MARQAITIDSRGFTEMARGLSKISGTPIRVILLSETARILEKCIKDTPKANRDAVERQVKFRNRSIWENGDPRDPKKRGKQIGYVTKRGTQWFADEPVAGYEDIAKGRRMGGRTFHDMNGHFRWNNDRWTRWQTSLDELRARQIDLRATLKSVGVAASSWYQIAKSLGISAQVKAPAYVINAVPGNGRTYINGVGKAVDSPGRLFVEISNSNPSVVTRMKGATILANAVQGRIAYFKKNVAKGVFDDLKSRARAYKGVFVT